MNSRHRYDYEIAADGAQQKVISFIGEGKRVLELGSGPGSVTKHLSANRCRVTALEVDDSAIELVKPYCENVYKCDLNIASWPESLPEIGTFDAIVAADVLEHLQDPLKSLIRCQEFLSPEGRVVVSLPHVGHAGVVACLLAGDFRYWDWGILDSTHIRFFGIKNIQQLFDDAGLNITDVRFVTKYPQQTEFCDQWQSLGFQLRRQLLKQKFATVYQVVVCASKVVPEGDGIDISVLDPPKPSRLTVGQFFRSTKSGEWLLSQVSPKVHEVIRRTVRGGK